MFLKKEMLNEFLDYLNDCVEADDYIDTLIDVYNNGYNGSSDVEEFGVFKALDTIQRYKEETGDFEIDLGSKYEVESAYYYIAGEKMLHEILNANDIYLDDRLTDDVLNKLVTWLENEIENTDDSELCYF